MREITEKWSNKRQEEQTDMIANGSMKVITSLRYLTVDVEKRRCGEKRTGGGRMPTNYRSVICLYTEPQEQSSDQRI